MRARCRHRQIDGPAQVGDAECEVTADLAAQTGRCGAPECFAGLQVQRRVKGEDLTPCRVGDGEVSTSKSD